MKLKSVLMLTTGAAMAAPMALAKPRRTWPTA